MPVPQEGPAEHIRNALQILVARKTIAEGLRFPPKPSMAVLSMDDVNAIIERLKSALATL